jgi:hypothetical protein
MMLVPLLLFVGCLQDLPRKPDLQRKPSEEVSTKEAHHMISFAVVRVSDSGIPFGSDQFVR